MQPPLSAFPRLWDFCLSLYAHEGVEALCLDCQDRHGLNVNLILWAVWLDRAEVLPNPPLWRAGEQLARQRQWRIGCWRGWRRRLPKCWPQLRNAIKQRELAAEKALLLQLEVLSRRHRAPARSHRQAPEKYYYLQQALGQKAGAPLYEAWRSRLQSWESDPAQ